MQEGSTHPLWKPQRNFQPLVPLWRPHCILSSES